MMAERIERSFCDRLVAPASWSGWARRARFAGMHRHCACDYYRGMYLERAQIVGLGPFDLLEVDFCERPGEPRPVTVIYGDGGTGKSTLLSSISATRPGNHIVQTSVWR